MAVMLDEYVATGGRLHSPYACRGEWCVIHNPSNHHMREWPRILRENTLIERRCPHGIGHPDPDSAAYFERIGREVGAHSCDGCCRKTPAEPEVQLRAKAITLVFEDGETTIVLANGKVSIDRSRPLSPAVIRKALTYLEAK